MDKKVLFGTLLLALSCGTADAQEPENGSYVCKVNLQEALLATLAHIIFFGDARR